MRKILMLMMMACSGISAQMVNGDSVKTWMFALAGDQMRGRANGSPEMQQAAEYIADRFDQAGLSPVPGTDSYFQPFQFTARRDGRLIAERNVIGFLEGADPALKEECIVVCAHYDHIGMGQVSEEDSVFNGADDNGSGTCAVMGVAQCLKDQKKRPARSVLFVAWAGEEMGLQGSRYYVQHPLWPLEKTAMVLNFELLGRPEGLGKKRFYLTGPAYSTLGRRIHAYNQNRSWQMVDSLENIDRLMFASDNAAFAAVHRRDGEYWGIVAHTMAMEWGGTHVHRLNDNPEFIDYENLADFIGYVTDVTLSLAALEEIARWENAHFHPLSAFKE